MTKKLICLLLAAFLGVSLIALLTACLNGGGAQEPTSQSTSLAPEGPEAGTDTTNVFSLEVPTADTEE